MPTAQQILAGNAAIVAEAALNVASGATRRSTKFLAPRGTVNVYRANGKIRVQLNNGFGGYRLGNVDSTGTIAWEDADVSLTASRARLGR